MLVEELMMQLAKFEPGTVVVVNMGKNGLANGGEVGAVEFIKSCRLVGSNSPWSIDYYLDNDSGYEYRGVINITT